MRSRLRPANTRLRVHLLTSVLVVASVLLVARAAELQLLHNEFYQQQGDARFLREIPIPTSRGMISDRNGEPLAVSTPVESIWADPRQLLQHAQRLPELATALGTDVEALTQRLSERAEREFIYLRRQMSPDEAAQILALDIPGVNSLREFRRFYPLGDMAAHVLGFTNIDDRGQEGLELAFDEWLSGKPGAKKVIRDRLGRVVENVDLVRAAEPGRALGLSIDRRIQHLAFRELKAALAEHGASSGSVVIMEIALLQPECADRGQRRCAAQPRGHRRVRAGVGDQGADGRRGAGNRPIPSRHSDRNPSRLHPCGRAQHSGHSQFRTGVADTPADQVEQCRRHQACAGHAERTPA
jgi:cell division protein FtsI (penicillin-binding protein 3)